MPTYRVQWEIDLQADSPGDAARLTLEIQRDPNSIGSVLKVDGKVMDLRHRCNLCGDLFAVKELREHLRAHSPAADSALEAQDLAQFFTPVV